MSRSTTNLKARFRGFLPVVIDIETAGFNPKTDAILEVAAVFVAMDAQQKIFPHRTIFFHIEPFEGAKFDVASLEFTGIDPYHPFRFAVNEKNAFSELFSEIWKEVNALECNRAVLVGHNPSFDLNFIKAAVNRHKLKTDPFHPFTTFDTATLGGVLFGQTVLAKAAEKAGIVFDAEEAHSAKYDAERTAELFCESVNRCTAIFERAYD